MTCYSPSFASAEFALVWIAEHIRADWLTPLMVACTNLGATGPILLSTSIVYWCWNKSYGKTIMYAVLISILTNLCLKAWFMECRPPGWLHLQLATSYAFPSGHAQLSMALWGGLAYHARSRLSSVLFYFVALLIGFSRNYLGVHYVHDVIVGLALGWLLLRFTLYAENKPYFLPAVAVLSFITLNVSSEHTTTQMCIGALLGLWIGTHLEKRLLCFSPPRSLLKIAQYIILGSIGIWLSQTAHARIDAPLLILFLTTFWITFGVPYLVARQHFTHFENR